MNTFAACNATTDGAGNFCGWATGGIACKAKACTDAIPNPSATTCVAYLSTCRFVGSVCVVAGACNTYALNSFAACNALTTDAGVACGWATGGTTCTAKACTDAIPNASAATCTAYLATCSFNGTACVAAAQCTAFAFTSAAACNLTTDGAGNFCGYAAGTACKARECSDPISNPSAATCTAYLSTCAFNGTACDAAAQCTAFAFTSAAACNLTTDGAGNFCGWATGGTACKAKACTDVISSPSATNCVAYLSTCRFVGSACVASGACTTYALTSFAACNALTTDTGVACGWATGGTTCTAKACTDPIPNPSAATCTAYMGNCAFNGTACVA